MPIAYPYRFSDWYCYDKDCVSLQDYHDGSGSTPVAGDACYSDSGGTSALAAGYYNINAATGVGNRLYIKISGLSGVVDALYPQYC